MPKTTTLTIRMDHDLKEWFERFAATKGLTQGEIARRLVEDLRRREEMKEASRS